MALVRLVACSTLLVAAASCADVGEQRSVWLQNTIVADNRDLIEREPVLTAGKFAKMASHPYNFFRGTQAQFLRDAAEPSEGLVATTFGDPATSRTLLVGDPHPENVGSFRNADGELVVDFNDFDACTYGPWHLDVRRLALGAWMAGHHVDADDEGLRRDMAEAVVTGYSGHIEELAAGGAPLKVRRGQTETIFEDLLRRADRDGGSREELAIYTEGGRIRLGELEASEDELVIADVMEPLTELDRRFVESVMSRYPNTARSSDSREALRAKDAGRRLGAGVSSYPVYRYYVLVEGPSTADADDVLLEVKEIRDAFSPPGDDRRPGTYHRTNAQRVVACQRQLQETAFDDPRLGWADVSGLSFRVRDRTRYQRGISVDRLAEKLDEGDFTRDDLVVMSELMGRLLARSHSRAADWHGDPGLIGIADQLTARQRELLVETMLFVDQYGPVVLRDHALFVDLLATKGPLLGYRRSR